MTFVEWLNNADDVYYLVGVDQGRICNAEECLDLNFAEEYIAYLRKFGVASFNNHEFTGLLAQESRLDVVIVTNKCKQYNPNIPSDLYVIEEWNIDAVVIWQDSSGKVYETIGNSEPHFIANSIVEYLLGLGK